MEIVVFLITLIVAVLVALGATPLARAIGTRLGVVDRPSALSIHSVPTARTGGLAIFVAFAVALLAAVMFYTGLSTADKMRLVGVLVGGAVVFGTGLLADTGKASPSIRLFSQAVAALMVVLAGLEVGLIPLLYISIPLTVFYLVGGANAFNLIDGIDGLAAGVAAVGCLFFGILSLWNGSSAGLVLSAALLGSSLGFLYFNFHPAKVFMGDGGSFLLGFVLASLAVLFTSTPYSFVWFAAPILVLGVPVFDTFLAIMRRLGGRKRLFLGDRRHFYDLVRARGWGDANTVLLMYGLAVVLGASALLVIHLELAAALVVIAVEAVALLVAALRLKALSSGM